MIHLTRLSKIGAQVKGFEPTNYMPKKLVREMDVFMQYAYASAEEALADSGIEIEPARTGIVMATAMGGSAATAEAQMQMAEVYT